MQLNGLLAAAAAVTWRAHNRLYYSMSNGNSLFIFSLPLITLSPFCIIIVTAVTAREMKFDYFMDLFVLSLSHLSV